MRASLFTKYKTEPKGNGKQLRNIVKLNRLKRSSFYLYPFREINGRRTSTEMQESSRYQRGLYVSVLPAGAYPLVLMEPVID